MGKEQVVSDPVRAVLAAKHAQLGLELCTLRGQDRFDLVVDHLILAHRLFQSRGLRLAAWQGR